jgi:hypothetical protein
VADVVGEVEVGVVDPDRAPLAEGYEPELLPEPGHQVKARGDVVAELEVGGRGPLEQGGRGDVHVRIAPLQVEERGVQTAQSLGHTLILAQELAV